MASAEAGVCNRALLRIGQTQAIANLTDANVTARTCLAEFADARDEVLEARPWPFAMRRATLAPLSGNTRDGWLYVCAWPADCVAPRYIHNPALQATVDPAGELQASPVSMQSALPVDIPFITENDEVAGNVILTNQLAPVLVYTARITAPALWGKHFTNALVFKLAAVLALSIRKSTPLAAAMDAKYEFALARAGRVFNNQKPPPRPMSVFERNR